MNTQTKLSTDLIRSRGLTLLLTAGKVREGLTELIAAQILHGPLFVVAASEWLPAFALTHLLRKRTRHVRQVLDRLYTARASTCYRLFDALANLPSTGEPVLVLDFLDTFYDPDIPLRVRLYKLRECCRELKRLSVYRPVVVITQDRQTEEYEKFLPALCSIADRTLTLEAEPEPARQPVLL
ncbi:MAG TPA: hypothetical protein VFO91_04105 [Anaerolineales bacterium]|nr:hypothetical protein [Anaerolineales bacterium]